MSRSPRPRTRRFAPPRLTSLEGRIAPAIFNVTNLNNSGAGSLRQAILDANALPGFDTINISATGTIALSTGQLFISEQVKLNGPGADKLTVQQNTVNARVFDVNSSTAVTITGLTITGGNVVSGAGVRVQGTTLNLQQCVVEKNSGLNGGGAWVSGGTAQLLITDTAFRDNTASGNGGGIYAANNSLARFLYETMSGNKAANGGAIWVSDANLQLGWATLSNNTATFDGGGINFQSPQSAIQTYVAQTTFAGNTAGQFGGAAFIFDQNDGAQQTVIVRAVTARDNDAKAGGGLFLSGSKVQMTSSVLEANVVTGADGPDAYLVGELSAGTSAIGVAPFVATGDPLFAFKSLGGNLTYGADLKLTTVGENGGATWTYHPQPGSPLIDAGAATDSTDQRLRSRPSNGQADIGSVEVQQFLVLNDTDAGLGSLRSALITTNSQPGPDFITFDPTFFSTSRTISLQSALPNITERVYVNGTGAGLLTVRRDPAAATSFRVFTVSNKSNQYVEIAGMTITGGVSTVDGGGILVDIDSRLILNRVTVTGNKTSFDGGGIAAWQNSDLAIYDSTVTGNSSGSTALDDGGGIYSIGTGFTLVRSLVAGNTTSAGQGGGIYRGTPDGLILMANSTVSGNSAGAGGGGIYLANLTRAYIWNSTITANSAVGGKGGGIMRVPASAEVFDVYGSVVSGNVNASAPDISAGGTVDVNYSAIGSATGFTLSGAKNLGFGTNLKLGPLANNGGPTQTHLPAFDSPLLEAGKDRSGGFYPDDQRGYPRQIGPSVDIGAVEVGRYIVTNADNSGPGSLREALLGANAVPGQDRIEFDPTFFSTKRTITLASGELLVADSVTIGGPGQALLTVNGNFSTRVFNVNGPGTIVVEMSGLTVANGQITGEGGGLLIEDENVTLIDCTITGNTASQDGGGIEMNATGGKLTLIRCTVSNNTATGATFDGGGVDAEASGIAVSIIDSTISGNKAGGEGGGIFIAFGSTLDMLGSTVINNQATGTGGGGVFIDRPDGNSFIRNTTFAGNSATADGGALYFAGASAKMFVFNSTIVGNTAGSEGGGIYLNGAASTLDLRSVAVSGNTAPVGPDVFSPGTVLAAFSLLGTAAGVTTFTPDATSTGLLGKNPLLGPLGANGGPTQTLLPLLGSPLIDVGSANGLPTDQRSLPRNSFGTDVGATELQQIVVTNANNSGAGSLRTALTTANSQAGTDWVRFDATAFASAKTISLLTALPAMSESIYLTGPGADLLTVRRDPSAGSFSVLSVTGTTTDALITGMTVTNGMALAGGGIAVGTAGALTLDGVVIAGNTASGSGGGVNVANGRGLTILNSTISGNTAGSAGGGVYSISFTSSVQILVRNSTISGNQASSLGGGIALANWGVDDTASVQNSTFTLNKAGNNAGGGFRATGTAGATVSLASTIVAGNSTADGSAPDIQVGVTTLKADNAIIGVADSGITNPIVGAGNQTGTKAAPLDANLGPLAGNGGPTPTHLPAAGSPALNKGSNPAGLAADQRGVSRTLDGTPDVGAVERPVGSLVVLNADDAGPGSLRQAVLDANTMVGADAITFDPAFFATAKTITLTGGQMAMTGDVTVTGPAAKVTVSGNNASRVFQIAGPGTLTVEFSGLTFKGGKSAAGGAIDAANTKLTLTNVEFTGNVSTSQGGAVRAVDSTVTLLDSRVTGNQASSFGGGLWVNGTAAAAVIRRSTLSGNIAGQDGGGAYVQTSLLLEDSTISGNSASQDGAGLAFRPTAGGAAMSARNSTFSGNTAGNEGGGITLFGANGVLSLRNSTLVGNSAKVAGGGIDVDFGGPVSVESTVIVGNSAPTGPDIWSFNGGKVDLKASAVGVTTGFTLVDLGGNQTGGTVASLKLGPLANNGGPTLTHAVLAGSPLINKGTNSAPALANDQRGAGFPRTAGSGTDIGAFEASVPPQFSSLVINAGAAQRSRVTQLAVAFNQFVTLPADPAAAFSLRRQSDGQAVTLAGTVDNTGPGTVVTLTFTGGVIEFGSLTDGRYNLNILASQISSPGGNFDGNGDGTGGDSLLIVGNPATNKLFRLFGDADGDGDVDAQDYGAFRGAFGGVNPTFDFDGDGDVDAQDYGQFRQRFGASV